jgi:hypothetical protein
MQKSTLTQFTNAYYARSYALQKSNFLKNYTKPCKLSFLVAWYSTSKLFMTYRKHYILLFREVLDPNILQTVRLVL